jgi:hypothetical protein
MSDIFYVVQMLRVKHALTVSLYLTCLSVATVTATTPAPFFSCTDYHCDEGQTVHLSNRQWQMVRNLFLEPAESPEDERLQIRQAIATLETEVGGITGTWRDLGKNTAGAGLPGQLDCISESMNTTTYLRLLEADELLRWHAVEAREVRTLLIFSHWSAVIRERNSGERYVVDSWFLDNGKPPYIQTLADWKSRRSFDSGQENLGNR